MENLYLIEFIATILLTIIIFMVQKSLSRKLKFRLKNSDDDFSLVPAPNNTCKDLIVPKRKLNIPYYLIFLVVCLSFIFIQYLVEKPKIPDVIEINVGDSIFDTNYTITYHSKNITKNVDDLKNIDTSTIKSENLTLHVPYLFGSYNKDVKINIVDKMPPVITCNLTDNQEVPYNTDFSNIELKVTDNVDTNLEEMVNIEKENLENGMCKVTFSVSDSSNNIGYLTLNLKLIDNVPPTITLNGNSIVTLFTNDTYEEYGACANDELDDDLTNNINISSNVDTSVPGSYFVTYTVSDKSSNESSITRQVIVKDKKNENQSMIYLTFDDGPSSNITPKILNTLKKYNIKATFFVINYSNENEYLIKRIVNEGHTIALHGYSHEYSQIYASKDAFMDNIITLRSKIKNSTGIDTNILRFPGGSSNTISKKYCDGIMSTLSNEVTNQGYTYFDWNVDSNDAGGANTKDAVYQNVTSHLRKNRSNVVLMHDASSKKATAEALEAIIEYGLNNGYTFSNITKSTIPVHHGINN